jgi:hypothetical protein
MVVCHQRWALMTFTCLADIFGIYCVLCLLQFMNQLQKTSMLKTRTVTPGLPRRITVCHFTLKSGLFHCFWRWTFPTNVIGWYCS